MIKIKKVLNFKILLLMISAVFLHIANSYPYSDSLRVSVSEQVEKRMGDTMIRLTNALPFKIINVPVMNSAEEMLAFIHKWEGYRFCIYLAYKDAEGWESSTSRRYMNKVLPGLIYLPVSIKKGDNEALERVYQICMEEDVIVAINHTQPHKNNLIARKLFAIQDENFDFLVKDKDNKFVALNLNGDAFSNWFLDEIGSYEGRDVVLLGVGGAGESIARNIIKYNPRAVYLIDITPKEQLKAELGDNVYYFSDIKEIASRVDGAKGIIFIFTAGKGFGEGLQDSLIFLEKYRNKSGIFVDIRPFLVLDTVEKTRELGWRAYTGNGMNARNDYVMLMKIAEKIDIACPPFIAFKQEVDKNSVFNINTSI